MGSQDIARQGLLPWLFQRVTGVLLVVGIGVHFLVGHYTGPLTTDAVQGRLQRLDTLVFDLMLVALLAFHGINGLRNVLLDYRPRNVRVVNAVAVILMIAMVLYCARDLFAFRGAI